MRKIEIIVNRTAILLALMLAAVSCNTIRKSDFPKFEVKDLEAKPDWWKVRPSEIIDLCEGVRKGHSEIVARTPLGYPVYAVFYGDFSKPAPQTNWSAGNASTAAAKYLGEDDGIQTILVAAGVHGAESESVAGVANIIQMMETGKDFRGQSDPELLSLMSRYRIIFMPCVNMDGRSISPDHLRNQPFEVFRAAAQGTWKDGSLIGWRGSKEWFPLPIDKVSYPGGYPNSEGYNIQHDVTPGDMKTEEAKAVCRLLARYRVDFFLNCHSHEYAPFLNTVSIVETPRHIARARIIADKANAAMAEAGLRNGGYNYRSTEVVNLDNMANICSGGLGMCLECSHSYDDMQKKTRLYTFDELMDPVAITLKVVLEDGLEKNLAERITTWH